MNDKIPGLIELDESQKTAAEKAVNDLRSSTAFLMELIAMGKCRQEDADTHMSLLRHGYDDLAALLGRDGISAELDAAHEASRMANRTLRALQKQAGARTTQDSAVAKLQQLEDAFQTWYELTGFHYVSIDWNRNGMKLDVSDQVNHKREPVHVTFGDKRLAAQIAAAVPYAFERPVWDLKKDSFHDNLLDTQGNRESIRDLLMETFPGAFVHGYSSHNDRHDYLLRATAFVPWDGVQAWLDSVTRNAPQADARGLYYLMLDEAEATLADEKYLKEMGPMLKAHTQKEADALRSAITAYETLQKNDLAEDLVLTHKGAELTVPAGTDKSAAMAMLGKFLKCDVARDLAGLSDDVGRLR